VYCPTSWSKMQPLVFSSPASWFSVFLALSEL